MESILELIKTHFPSLIEHRYLFLFIAASIEGFNTLVLAGFLVSIGAMSLVPAALAGFAGEVINSYFWYALGYFGGARPLEWFTRKSQYKRDFVEKIRKYFELHAGKLLLLVKVTFSLTIITMLLTGSMRYSPKKFTFYNILGSLGWVVVTFGIGFFFGQGYKLYLEYFQSLGYLILFLAAAAVIIYFAEHISSAIVTHTVLINDRLQELNQKIKEGISRFLDDPNERG